MLEREMFLARQTFDEKENKLKIDGKRFHSKCKVDERRSIVQFRADLFDELKRTSTDEIRRLFVRRSFYIKFMFELLVECLLVMSDVTEDLLVQCRQEDLGLVERLIDESVERTRSLVGVKRTIRSSVDSTRFIAENSFAFSAFIQVDRFVFSFRIGGLVVHSVDRRFSLYNRVEDRIDRALAMIETSFRRRVR